MPFLGVAAKRRDGGDSEVARICNHLGFTELRLRLRTLGRMTKRNVK